jgi:penicillin-binding protein 2
MEVAKEKNPRLMRVNFIYGMVFVALTTLILRLGYLQIARGAEFRQKANTTMLAQIPVLPSRGWIYDTNGVLLAYDEPSFSIVLTRLHTKEQDQSFNSMAEELAPVLGMTKQQFLDLIYSKKYEGQPQIRLLENANPRQVAFVQEHQSDLIGVHVEVEPRRVYKYGDLAGQVLGYVGAQSSADRPKYEKKGYYIDQKVGKDGVELQYEDLLQGKLGYRVVETNSRGIPIKDFGLDPAPTAGKTLQLTIDAKLQADAQQIVMDGLNEVRKKYGYSPTEASAVMLNPNTGEILAMVSYPYYSPQWFMDPKAFAAHRQYLYDPQLTPTVNHVISSYHEPGSTVKPANLIAGLMTHVISPNTTIYDPGYAQVGTDRRKDDQPGGHGIVDPIKAIQVSCDTFFYYLGMWLADWRGGPPPGESVAKWFVTGNVKGLNTLFSWEYKFGLGQLTHIDLPGEVQGKFYRTPDNSYPVPYNLQEAIDSMKKKGYYEKHGQLYDNAIAGIGQMQAFTPIELAQYISALANGGKRIQPHVLKAVYPEGTSPSAANTGSVKPELVVKPKVLDLIKIDPEYLQIVRQGMYDVVNKPGGTAYGSFIDAPYKAAGKTGTAQVGNRRDDTSMFMAYAPFDNPQVAVVVMVPGGGSSYETAVPIARKLFDAYFKEHHMFFPTDQWTNPGPPDNWFKMSAYTAPEDAIGSSYKQ